MESAIHENAIATEMVRRSLLRIVRQKPIPVVYENVRIETGFRADLIVGDKVIVEIESVELLAPVPPHAKAPSRKDV